jgi:hypothetical protein
MSANDLGPYAQQSSRAKQLAGRFKGVEFPCCWQKASANSLRHEAPHLNGTATAKQYKSQMADEK